MAAARIRDSFELLSRMEHTKRPLRISFQLDARGGRAGAARLSRGHGPGGQPWRRLQVTPLAAPNSGVLVSRLLPVADLSVASDLEHDPGKQWGRLVVGWALHRVGVLGNRHGQQYQRLQLSEGAATLFQSNHSPASAATPAPIWCAWTASRASPVQWPVARRSPAQVS